MTTITTEARHTSLARIREILIDQHARKVDVVAPASALRFKGGRLHVRGAEVEIDLDKGVGTVDGVYDLSEVFVEGLADKFQIPVKYVRRMLSERSDIFDATLNAWIHGKQIRKADGTVDVLAEGDARSFLVRAFRGDDGVGLARHLASDRYEIMDSLDALTGLLAGISDSGLHVEFPENLCNLSERSVRIRAIAPEIRALAPALLAGYRSPFAHGATRAGGATGLDALAEQMGQDPIVFAGLDIRNSEVGNGALSIVPVVTILICTNGMTFTKHAVREVHLGGRLDHGQIRFTDDTVKANIALIRSMTADAVRQFLSPEWLAARVAEIEAEAGRKIEGNAEAEVTRVTRALKFDETTQAGIWDHFIRAGQFTAGGVANAVTSYAQSVADPDKASEIEDKALDALTLAAR